MELGFFTIQLKVFQLIGKLSYGPLFHARSSLDFFDYANRLAPGRVLYYKMRHNSLTEQPLVVFRKHSINCTHNEKKAMYKSFLITVSLAAAFTAARAQEPRLRKIFNGRDLKGWHASQGADQWKAEKGLLRVRNNAERKGSILWTDAQYGDFIIQADFRMGDGVVDSGIFLRSESDQVQIGISGSLKRDLTASPYIPGKGYPVEARDVQRILRPKDWNTMRVKVVGNAYAVWLNGEEVMRYTSSTIPAKGSIGLQLHPKNEMSIDFRNIRLASL